MAYESRSSRSVLTIFAVLFSCILCSLGEVKNTVSTEEILFQNFISEHQKPYITGTIDYEKRFRVFQESLRRISKLNSFSNNQTGTALYGLTQFSDLTPEEFKQQYLTLQPNKASSIVSLKPAEFFKVSEDIPPKYDLRDLNAVTPVRDQKTCGGCWAFSTVEGMATKRVLKGGPLQTLSSQQLIDCDVTDNGCKGGDTCNTMKWLEGTKVAVVEEGKYPFVAKTGNCRMVNTTGGVRIKSYTCKSYVANETKMVEALYSNGSLVVAVDATSWQDYLGGIIQHHCTHHSYNHAVQIVGYDTTGEIPYYIVRNSWGPKWGLSGYLRIKIGGNMCSIASRVSTVDVE